MGARERRVDVLEFAGKARSRTYGHVLRWELEMVTGGLLGVLGLSSLVVVVSGAWEMPQARDLDPIIAGLCVVASTVLLSRKGGRPFALAVMSVATLLAYTHPSPGDGINQVALYTPNVTCLVAAVVLCSRRTLLLLVPLHLAGLGLHWAVRGRLPVTVIDYTILNVGLSVVATYAVVALTSAASRTDSLAEQLAHSEAEERRTRAEQATVENARRMLHDEVIAALHAVATLPVEASAAVGRACRSAVAAMHRTALLTRDLRGCLEDAAAEAPVTVTVAWSGSCQDLPADLPDNVTDAIAGATREALRNVARHSGSPTATIRVSCAGSGVCVDVVDHGVGIDQCHQDGFGITSSITRRMEDVGGRARVMALPAGGTRVALTWAPSAGAATGIAAAAPEMPLRDQQLAVNVAVPLLVCHLFLVANHAPRQQHAAALYVLAGVLAGCVLLTVARLRMTRPGLAEVVVWTAVMSALMGIGLVLTGPESMLSTASWPIGFAQLPLMLLAYRATRWELIVIVLVPLAVLLVAVAVDPVAGLGPSMSTVGSSCLPALIMFAVGSRIGSAVRRGDEFYRRAVRAALAGEWRRRLDRERERYLSHTQGTVIPFLQMVADAPGARDELVRRRAQLHAMEVRDDMYAPGLITAGLRDQAAGFRQRGGRLRLSPMLPRGIGTHHQLRDTLRAMLAELPGDHTLTVAPAADTPSAPRVVVVPVLSARIAAVVATLGGVVHRPDPARSVLHFEPVNSSERR